MREKIDPAKHAQDIRDAQAEIAAMRPHPCVLAIVDMQTDYPAARDKALIQSIETAADSHPGPLVQVMYEGAGESTVELGVDVPRIWKQQNEGGDELYAWLLGAHLITRDIHIAVCGVNLWACVRETAAGILQRLSEEQGLTGTVSIIQDLCGDLPGALQIVPELACVTEGRSSDADLVRRVIEGEISAEDMFEHPPELALRWPNGEPMYRVELNTLGRALASEGKQPAEPTRGDPDEQDTVSTVPPEPRPIFGRSWNQWLEDRATRAEPEDIGALEYVLGAAVASQYCAGDRDVKFTLGKKTLVSTRQQPEEEDLA